MSKTPSFAAGGPVLGRTRDFLKEPDRFRDSQFKKAEETEDDFGKGSTKNKAAPPAKGKSLPVIKPKK